MQLPAHSPRYLLAIALVAISWACYPHTGQASDNDSERWHELAVDACQRGDHGAYKTLIERTELDEDDRSPCPAAAAEYDSTSGDDN